MATEVDSKLKLYREIQTDIQKLFTQKQQALSQFNENTLVQGELDLLDEDVPIYKLVGPVMMNVEIQEAKDNVQKRLDFIEGEIQKLDDSIAKLQGEQAEIGDQISSIQTRMQKEASLAASSAAGL